MKAEELESAFNSAKKKSRLCAKIEDVLNKNIEGELVSSQIYLGLAVWCDYTGYQGLAKYFYTHVDEERGHMRKLYDYMLDRNAMPKTPMCPAQNLTCTDLKDAIEKALARETEVTARYEAALPIALQEKDQMTYEFLQWFIHEQREEEATLLGWLDRLEIIGYDKKGMFFLDQEIAEA